MNLKYLVLLAFTAISYGCASVPMESEANTRLARAFNPPAPGKAGIYVYRKDTPVGAALKKDVWIDGECIGETAAGVFFYHEVAGDAEHKISTESEFSPNDLVIYMKSGMHYFVEQFIKFGAFVGGAGLQAVEQAEGKEELAGLVLARKGSCNSQP